MTTAFVDASSAAPLSFPHNVGMSGTAYALADHVRDFEVVLLDRSMSIGWHYLRTLESLVEAAEMAAADNWDGYGANAIDQSSLTKAIRLSKLMPMNVPVPEVSVDTDGEVRFEWYRGPRQVFSVAVRGNGDLVYAGLFGPSEVHGLEYLGEELPPSLFASIRRVYA